MNRFGAKVSYLTATLALSLLAACFPPRSVELKFPRRAGADGWVCHNDKPDCVLTPKTDPAELQRAQTAYVLMAPECRDHAEKIAVYDANTDYPYVRALCGTNPDARVGIVCYATTSTPLCNSLDARNWDDKNKAHMIKLPTECADQLSTVKVRFAATPDPEIYAICAPPSNTPTPLPHY